MKSLVVLAILLSSHAAIAQDEAMVSGTFEFENLINADGTETSFSQLFLDQSTTCRYVRFLFTFEAKRLTLTLQSLCQSEGDPYPIGKSCRVSAPIRWEDSRFVVTQSVEAEATFSQIDMDITQEESNHRFTTRVSSDNCSVSLEALSVAVLSVEPEGAMGDDVQALTIVSAGDPSPLRIVRAPADINFDKVLEELYQQNPNALTCESCPLPERR